MTGTYVCMCMSAYVYVRMYIKSYKCVDVENLCESAIVYTYVHKYVHVYLCVCNTINV